ncbi:MAG: POTRA domain-containing protein, partial [Pseudomonadales bacterium]
MLVFAVLAGANKLPAAVVIEGVSDDISDAISAQLTLGDNCELADWLVRYRFLGSDREIKQSLETFGYYNPVIDKQLDLAGECWLAIFRIDPGPPAMIQTANVAILGEGRELLELDRVIATSSVQVGTRFDHETYESLKSGIENVAAHFGFLEGRFASHRVEVDIESNAVRVDLVYDTGPRFQFGAVTFNSDHLSEDVLKRYVPFEEGDVYDVEKLGELYQSLLASGYFDDVILDTSRVDGKTVPVNVTLVFGKTSVTRIGIGYSTDLGPRLFIDRNRRLVNARGHQFQIDASVSPVERQVGGFYRIPQGEDKDGWVSLYGGYRVTDTDTSYQKKATMGIRQIVPRGGGWIETRFFEIVNEQFEVADESNSNLSFVPGLNYSHTRTDSLAARVRRAHRISFEVSGTSRSLGSTLDFVSATSSAKMIRPLGDNLRVIARGRVGITRTEDFDRLPPNVRFFSGG